MAIFGLRIWESFCKNMLLQVPYAAAHAATKAALNALRVRGLLSFRQENQSPGAAGVWSATTLGRAVVAGGLPTEAGMKLYATLDKVQDRGIVLSSSVHLIYLLLQVFTAEA